MSAINAHGLDAMLGMRVGIMSCPSLLKALVVTSPLH